MGLLDFKGMEAGADFCGSQGTEKRYDRKDSTTNTSTSITYGKPANLHTFHMGLH